MTGSPTAYLLWAILAVLFQSFLILHLWSYDRFKCVRWHAGRQPGAFRRVMTYSYLSTVPLLVFFGVAISSLKFKEGYMAYGGLIFPKPIQSWQPDRQAWLLPLFFIFSIAWSLEHVTHLEELCFWFFLLHQGPRRRAWFSSGEYRLWTIGSIATILGMPLTTLVSRRDLNICEAWIFLIGSSVSTATTVIFLYVLNRFPTFLNDVKAEGADPDVVLRLSTFYNLNLIRVLFRFLFTLPLLILAVDALAKGPHYIDTNPFSADFLLMLGALGCFVSSCITLLIFFPRTMTKDPGYRPRPPSISMAATAPSPKSVEALANAHTDPDADPDDALYSIDRPFSAPPAVRPRSSDIINDNRLVSTPELTNHERYPTRSTRGRVRFGSDPEFELDMQVLEQEDREEPPSYMRHSPNAQMYMTESRSSRRLDEEGRFEQGWSPPSNVHPYVASFTSPIDLPEVSDDGLPRAV